MMKPQPFRFAVCFLGLLVWTVGTQADVNVRAENITTLANDGNDASVTVGGIEDDTDVQGITVINGRVSIDGKAVAPSVRRYKSPRTGTVYLIERKNGSVSVAAEGGKK